MQMKTMSLAFACALLVGSGAAMAAGTAATAKPRTAQQQRMVDCNHQATGKTGDERKAFMKSCLSGSTAAAPAPAATPVAAQTQQEKMKTCSADARQKKLKGAERKSYMSTCLKGGAAPAAH
jgi:hypothetical protein